MTRVVVLVALWVHVIVHVTVLMLLQMLQVAMLLANVTHMMIMDSVGMVDTMGMVRMCLAELEGEVFRDRQVLVFEMRQKIVHVRNRVKVAVCVVKEVFRNAFMETAMDVH